MKKPLTALMVLAFGLGASTSFAQNAEPEHMTAPAAHNMKMDAPQAHQAAPAPQAKRMPPAPHQQAKKKKRMPKHRMAPAN